MSAATYTRNPIVSSAVNVSQETGAGVTANNRSSPLFTTTSTQYAIINIHTYNGNASSAQLSVGLASATGSSAPSLGNTIYAKPISTTTSDNSGPIYIGPGMTVYWGASVDTVRLSVTGTIFVNG